jgi:tetratricopeptide (TPR) repeat protein
MSGPVQIPGLLSSMSNAALRTLAVKIPLIAQWIRSRAEKHAAIALRAYKENNTGIAIEQFSKAIELDAYNSDYLNDLGQLYYETENLPKATELFFKALELDYSNADALKGMAFSLDQQGKRNDAIYYYLRAARIRPGDYDIYVNLLTALYDTGKYEDVVTHGERAVKAFPNDPEIIIYLAWGYFLSGKMTPAIQRLKEARRSYPANFKIHYFLGVFLEAQGDIEGAEESFRASTKIEPENADAYLGLCRIFNQAARWAELLDAAQKALVFYECAADNEGAFSAGSAIGWANYKLNNWRESVRASEAALKHDDSSAQTRFNLGLALLRMGDVERARKEYERASSQADENVLKSDGIKDLTEALAEEPTLCGAEKILQTLVEKLNAVTKKRCEAS